MLRNDEIREKNVYKSPFMVSVNGFKYFMLTLAITLIGYFWMGHLSVKDTSYDTVRICTLIAVAIMSIEYVNFAKYFIEKRRCIYNSEYIKSSPLMMSVNDVLKQKCYQLQHLSCNIQQVYKKHIVNIQQICLYNTNTIITSMTIKA